MPRFSSKYLGVALVLSLTWGVPQAQEISPAPEVSPKVRSWADRCTDFTTNGWAFKAPANFLPWLEVFSDPGVWLEFTRRGMDPQYYVRSANSMLDPAMVKNYLEWTDPIILEKWSQAMVEPEFITAVYATLFDPGKFMRWAMLPLEPKTWELMLTAARPDTWMKWVNAPFAPDTQAFVSKLADPNTPLRLLQALQDPANYPGLTWIQPPSEPADNRVY